MDTDQQTEQEIRGYYVLDVVLENTLEGMGQVAGDQSMLNWYQGRAAGAGFTAWMNNTIPAETYRFLNEMVKGWFDYYAEERGA